jgi:asparagine synthase (glutamine-hydrolysing)
MMNIIPKTQSDCEVIIHLYEKYGINQTLRMLDGVFSFVLYSNNHIIIARDPYGVRPLYYLDDYKTKTYMVASELKSLVGLAEYIQESVCQFKPGTYTRFDITEFTSDISFDCPTYVKYHALSSNIRTSLYSEKEYENWKIFMNL